MSAEDALRRVQVTVGKWGVPSMSERQMSGAELLRDLLDAEREEAQDQARWLSFIWISVTVGFLALTLFFILSNSDARWLSTQAEALGAPEIVADRLELAALAPVLANVSGAVFLNFWRVRRRKLRLILAEALVIDGQFEIARGVLFGSDNKKGRVWRRIRNWASRRAEDRNEGGAGI